MSKRYFQDGIFRRRHRSRWKRRRVSSKKMQAPPFDSLEKRFFECFCCVFCNAELTHCIPAISSPHIQYLTTKLHYANSPLATVNNMVMYWIAFFCSHSILPSAPIGSGSSNRSGRLPTIAFRILGLCKSFRFGIASLPLHVVLIACGVPLSQREIAKRTSRILVMVRLSPLYVVTTRLGVDQLLNELVVVAFVAKSACYAGLSGVW